ncbi:O-methyltransferase [Micrococcales bacterium 31B]|nr:O-methyltransferase [Micrococcales bacterium 31B]
MVSGKPGSWAYCEEFLPEDDILLRARERAAELGCVPVQPGVGAALATYAAALNAKAVVEIGTGTGVSSLYVLRSMDPAGVLTTIDVEQEHIRAAKEAFSEAGIRPQRARTITGRALDVLPRLADSSYDMVILDADKNEYHDYLAQALRVLRPGGAVVIGNTLLHDRVADPANRDEKTQSIRELNKTVRDNPELIPAMLPSGDGLLVGIKRR